MKTKASHYSNNNNDNSNNSSSSNNNDINNINLRGKHHICHELSRRFGDLVSVKAASP
jgi:hypothetical protein